MPEGMQIPGLLLLGGGLGALCLSLVTLLAHWLIAPVALEDGQYAMVFFISVPCGAFLGAVTALSMSLSLAHKLPAAGWVGLIGGGMILIAAIGFTWFWSARDGLTIKDIVGIFCFWFGLSVLWAAALVIRGLLFVKS
jgi:hypothetical protein